MIRVKGHFRGTPTEVLWSEGVLLAPDAFVDAAEDLFMQPTLDLGPLTFLEAPSISDAEDAAYVIEFLFDDITSTNTRLGYWQEEHGPSADNIVKHLPGQHDQSSHGSWADAWGSSTANSTSITGASAQLLGLEGFTPPSDESHVDMAREILDEIASSKGINRSLYHGSSWPKSRVESLSPGDVITLPLTATSTDESFAAQIGNNSKTHKRVLIHFEGVPVAEATPDQEYLTAGNMEVVDVETVTDPFWKTELTLVSLRGAPTNFSKHYGPGPHPGTGTEQDVHGHGAGFLEPMQGEAQLKTKPTQAFLVTEDGAHPHVTMKGLDKLKQLKGGKTYKIAARNEILDKIKATMSTYDITDADMDNNLRTVLDSAMARYADHPDLIEADKFYKIWHEKLLEISETHDRDFDDVIAAASAISPGLNADDNLQFAEELAELVNENPTFSELEANTLATQFQGNAYMLRNPVFTEHHKEVIDGKVEIGTPRGPETRPSVLAVASQLDDDADKLRNASDAQLLDLSNEGAARAAHWMRQQKKGAGFQVKTYSYYADAIEVLRDGETTANETLRGIKTRSFYNNILDPDNDFGRDDVTVDYHTINFAAFGLGADANTHIQGTPSYGSVSLGIRPAVADAVRRLEPYARERHDMELHGSRIQEILWAEWRRGTSATGRGSNTWVSYDGTTYDLKDLSG